MMMNDKKSMAMMIIGKKEKPEDDMDMKKDEYKDEDMEKDALEYCMKGFMKAVQHEDVEKALKLFKKLNYLTDMYMKDEHNSDDDY